MSRGSRMGKPWASLSPAEGERGPFLAHGLRMVIRAGSWKSRLLKSLAKGRARWLPLGRTPRLSQNSRAPAAPARVFTLIVIALGVAGGALLLPSCASWSGTVVAPVEIPGAHYMGDKACADCHGEIVRKFPASPHARVRFTGGDLSGQTGCESCHGPASKHVQDAAHRFIVNPGKNVTACFQCHLETRAQFGLPQRHLVIEGRMSCAQCHDPHGADILKPAGGPAMAQLNQTCAQCHREQTRPVVFEHQAMREGCTVCHNPHGSINRKLLTEPDANLCLRCHAQNQSLFAGSGTIFIGAIDHTTFLSRATCWAAGCHTAVHGSNVDPRLRY